MTSAHAAMRRAGGFRAWAGAMFLLGVAGGDFLRADPEPAIPGSRLRGSPAFAAWKPNDQTWALRSIDAASRQLVPHMREAQSVVIYSLDPTKLENFRADRTDRTHFHGYVVLGRATLWREADLNLWREKFVEGLVPAEMAVCFEPRHAIRIETPKSTIDLVLCFECGRMRAFGARFGEGAHEFFFDTAVRDWLNTLLDTRQIRRDIPRPPQ